MSRPPSARGSYAPPPTRYGAVQAKPASPRPAPTPVRIHAPPPTRYGAIQAKPATPRSTPTPVRVHAPPPTRFGLALSRPGTVQAAFSESGGAEFAELSRLAATPSRELRDRAVALLKGEKNLEESEKEDVKQLIGKFDPVASEKKKKTQALPLPPSIAVLPIIARPGLYFSQYAPRSGIRLAPHKWNTVIENVSRLTQSEPTVRLYEVFFDKALTALAMTPDSVMSGMVAGLSELFEKLSSAYSNERSLGNYKGAVAEIVDALGASWFVAGGSAPSAVTLPSEGHREPVHPSYRGVPAITHQDIDRIETFGSTRYYVEVKADVATAIDKHGKINPAPQLVRIVGVVKQAEATDTVHRHEAAVSVVNAAEWLRFFSAGTARLYSKMGVWLFIGGERFDPPELRLLSDHVQSTMQGIERDFFHLNLGTFASPRDVKALLRGSKLPPLSVPDPIVASDPTPSPSLNTVHLWRRFLYHASD